MIRVVLPGHLRTLARVDGEVTLHVEGPVTQRAVLDALEAGYPALRGTIRDQVTRERRAFMRFFACQQDLSHEPPDAPLPDAVATGTEPLLVVGAMAGGSGRSPGMTYALWIVQGALALVFLFAGGMKLILPLDKLAGPVALPGLFVRFLGVAEVLGAIGLILPGLLRIRPGLTPLAASGLAIIMIGATVITLASGDVATAVIPLVVGFLAAFVAYGRRRPAGPA